MADNLKTAAKNFMDESIVEKYSYNFEWMGRPIIQYPQDIIAMQEIIFNVQPDLFALPTLLGTIGYILSFVLGLKLVYDIIRHGGHK